MKSKNLTKRKEFKGKNSYILMPKEIVKFVMFILSIVLIMIGFILSYPSLIVITSGNTNTQSVILLIMGVIFILAGLSSLINFSGRKRHGKRRK